MILSPQHHHPHHLHPSIHPLSSLHPNLPFYPKTHLFTPTKPFISSSLNEPDSSSPNKPQIFRKHNAKSTALLLHHLSPSLHQEQEITSPLLQSSEEEKLKILELALVRRRTPQFSGSIYLPTSSDLSSSPPPLSRLFPQGESDLDNDKMLKQALEIRRKVTAEVFVICMRSEKFSITYSTNLVGVLMNEFIDHVMIEAALMKSLPEFENSSFNARAKMFIQNSNVVPLIRWLKHNSMTYPQIGKLLCMSCGNLESIRLCIQWLKTIYVKGQFLGTVLIKAGGVLERGTDQLEEIVQYMESNGVRREWMGFVVSRCPKILSFTMEEVRTRVGFYKDMGMNSKDFGTMVFDYPKSFGQLSLEEMTLKVNYLKEFGLSNEEVGRLIAFKPQLMACSVEERWKPLVKYLYYLGIRRDGMRRMLTLKPMVFCVDLETTIAPKVRFLREIGVKEDAIGNMLVKFPTLLTYSLYKKIRPVVIFLLTKAGVSQKDVGKVIALGPELVGCKIVHKLEVNVKYFLSLGILLPQLGEMIADFPMLLRYNLEVLRPKYRYLRRIMIRPLEDLIEFPRFFSYSLDGRIIPRHKVVVENRLNFKLRYMLGCSDQVFDERVEAAVEKRRKFESGEVDVPLSDSEETDDDFIEADQVRT
ncbi:Transcription termination factor mterf2 [Ranunculus cassubicifolius]